MSNPSPTQLRQALSSDIAWGKIWRTKSSRPKPNIICEYLSKPGLAHQVPSSSGQASTLQWICITIVLVLRSEVMYDPSVTIGNLLLDIKVSTSLFTNKSTKSFIVRYNRISSNYWTVNINYWMNEWITRNTHCYCSAFLYVRDHATFFYVLETVFDVCLIYVEEYWNNQTELCDKTTLDMYVCIALMLQKRFLWC